MSLQQVTCFCLLDLSATFDTIDHSMLLEPLRSWFGFNNTVLSWIKLYLAHQSFYVNLIGAKFSVLQPVAARGGSGEGGGGQLPPGASGRGRQKRVVKKIFDGTSEEGDRGVARG
jgi:hypothetical protein